MRSKPTRSVFFNARQRQSSIYLSCTVLQTMSREEKNELSHETNGIGQNVRKEHDDSHSYSCRFIFLLIQTFSIKCVQCCTFNASGNIEKKSSALSAFVNICTRRYKLQSLYFACATCNCRQECTIMSYCRKQIIRCN